jgi:serine/threonine protein kinase
VCYLLHFQATVLAALCTGYTIEQLISVHQLALRLTPVFCSRQVVDSAAMLYLVMEYAPNQSLLDYVRSRKRLAEGKAALVLQQIVAGLQYCHRKEVVHR